MQVQCQSALLDGNSSHQAHWLPFVRSLPAGSTIMDIDRYSDSTRPKTIYLHCFSLHPAFRAHTKFTIEIKRVSSKWHFDRVIIFTLTFYGVVMKSFVVLSTNSFQWLALVRKLVQSFVGNCGIFYHNCHHKRCSNLHKDEANNHDSLDFIIKGYLNETKKLVEKISNSWDAYSFSYSPL